MRSAETLDHWNMNRMEKAFFWLVSQWCWSTNLQDSCCRSIVPQDAKIWASCKWSRLASAARARLSRVRCGLLCVIGWANKQRICTSRPSRQSCSCLRSMILETDLADRSIKLTSKTRISLLVWHLLTISQDQARTLDLKRHLNIPSVFIVPLLFHKKKSQVCSFCQWKGGHQFLSHGLLLPLILSQFVYRPDPLKPKTDQYICRSHSPVQNKSVAF